jgi:hypothetical protein
VLPTPSDRLSGLGCTFGFRPRWSHHLYRLIALASSFGFSAQGGAITFTDLASGSLVSPLRQGGATPFNEPLQYLIRVLFSFMAFKGLQIALLDRLSVWAPFGSSEQGVPSPLQTQRLGTVWLFRARRAITFTDSASGQHCCLSAHGVASTSAPDTALVALFADTMSDILAFKGLQAALTSSWLSGTPGSPYPGVQGLQVALILAFRDSR